MSFLVMRILPYLAIASLLKVRATYFFARVLKYCYEPDTNGQTDGHEAYNIIRPVLNT